MDGFDVNETKKTKCTENTEKSSLQRNDYRIKVIVKKIVLLGFFFLANAPASDKKDLLSELDVMKKLKPHPHVIKLLGCITETGKGCVKRVTYQFLEICGIQVYATEVFNYSHGPSLVHQRGRRSIVLEHIQFVLHDVCHMEQFNRQKILEWIYHCVEQSQTKRTNSIS